MINAAPVCSETKVDDAGHTWTPNSFSSFLRELSHLTSLCTGEDPVALCRGHADRDWLLESTLARSCKQLILGLSPSEAIGQRVQESVEYHRIVLNVLLLKFGVIERPPCEDARNRDTWYELMRELQQYPERDLHHLKGTFYLDWTVSPDVAVFFANVARMGDGAVWVCDAAATGKTLQEKQLGEILDLMNETGNRDDPGAPGCPLLFHPPSRSLDLRAERQQAVYIAQMDLRFDLASLWISQEENEDSTDRIFVKLILPNGTQQDCSSYLAQSGITESWLFPPYRGMR